MSNPSAPNTLSALNNFKFDRVINEDPLTHSLTLLGTFPNSSEPVPAIVRVEKTALDPTDAPRLLGDNGLIQRAVMEESTDIYTWFFGWLGDNRESDLKINVICPATEVHIHKW